MKKRKREGKHSHIELRLTIVFISVISIACAEMSQVPHCSYKSRTPN